jgi:hypothetical protein
LQEEVKRWRGSCWRGSGVVSAFFKKAVRAMVRRGLRREAPQLPRFEVKAKACGFQAGVDLLRLNQLNDELEVEDLQRELAAARRQQ